MLDTPSSAPLVSVRQLSDLHSLVPKVSLRRYPANQTLGLLHFIHPRSQELVRIFLSQPMPSPDAPFLRSGGLPTSPTVAAYLAFAEAYARDPLFALAQYVARLDHLIASHQDEAGFLRDERYEWTARYAQLLQPVIEQCAIPEDRTTHYEAHFFWQAQPDGALNRPQASIGGLEKVPVFKLLWSLYAQGRKMPGGHPRKVAYCPDKFSYDPAQNTRLCVNPLHFETTELQHNFKLDEWWRPGIERRSIRFRWDLLDASYDSRMGWWFCPNEHKLDQRDVDRLTAQQSGRFICRKCKEDRTVTLWDRGRDHVGYRNRWSPTIPEIHEQAEMLKQMYKGPQRSHHAKDDELSDEEWIVRKLAEANAQPDDEAVPDPYTMEF